MSISSECLVVNFNLFFKLVNFFLSLLLTNKFTTNLEKKLIKKKKSKTIFHSKFKEVTIKIYF